MTRRLSVLILRWSSCRCLSSTRAFEHILEPSASSERRAEVCPGKEGDRAGMSDRSATLADLDALENLVMT